MRDADAGPDAEPPEASGGPPVAHLIDRRGRCRLVYAPIADLARGTICGYEAVERFPEAPAHEVWRTEALRRGLEPDYDAYVVSSVLQARESLPDGCFLAFDVRPATLLREPVRRVLARAGELDGLVIELAPRIARRDEARFAACIEELRAAGARFAVEAGGEDAVLRFVGLVRPAFAKLNALLVADLHRWPAKRALLYEIERIASRFGTTLVAQGVSRTEELDALMGLRVPLAQGPLIGVRGKTLTPVAFALSRYVRERGGAMLRARLARIAGRAGADGAGRPRGRRSAVRGGRGPGMGRPARRARPAGRAARAPGLRPRRADRRRGARRRRDERAPGGRAARDAARAGAALRPARVLRRERRLHGDRPARPAGRGARARGRPSAGRVARSYSTSRMCVRIASSTSCGTCSIPWSSRA